MLFRFRAVWNAERKFARCHEYYVRNRTQCYCWTTNLEFVKFQADSIFCSPLWSCAEFRSPFHRIMVTSCYTSNIFRRQAALKVQPTPCGLKILLVSRTWLPRHSASGLCIMEILLYWTVDSGDLHILWIPDHQGLLNLAVSFLNR
jgi:hypothetical protein